MKWKTVQGEDAMAKNQETKDKMLAGGTIALYPLNLER